MSDYDVIVIARGRSHWIDAPALDSGARTGVKNMAKPILVTGAAVRVGAVGRAQGHRTAL